MNNYSDVGNDYHFIEPKLLAALNEMNKLTSPNSKSQQTPAEDAPSCDEHLVHLDTVRQVQPEMLSMQKAQQMSEFFGVLSDPNRLRLMSALASRELCVCDLAAAIKLTESAVSHQLRVLRSARLVKYRKEGRNVYYSLADTHVINLYQEVTDHMNEH